MSGLTNLYRKVLKTSDRDAIFKLIRKRLEKEEEIIKTALSSTSELSSSKVVQEKELGLEILIVAVEIVRNKKIEEIKSNEYKSILKLLNFIADSMHVYECLPILLKLLFKLLKYFVAVKIPSTNMNDCMEKLFKEVSCQTMDHESRGVYWEIITLLLKHHQSTIKSNFGPRKFYTELLKNIEGERDPVNLISVFEIIQLFSQPFGLIVDEKAEETFDTFGCYFPVDFKKSPNDRRGVSQNDLANSLERVLTLRSSFAQYSYPFYTEKLTFFPRNKVRIIDLLSKSIMCFGRSKHLYKVIHELWMVLTTELIRTQISGEYMGGGKIAPPKDSIPVERMLITAFTRICPIVSFEGEEQEVLISLIDRGYNWIVKSSPSPEHFKTYLTLCGKLLTSVATSSSYNCQKCLGNVLPKLMKLYNEKTEVLEICNQLNSAALLYLEGKNLKKEHKKKIDTLLDTYFKFLQGEINVEDELIISNLIEGLIKNYIALKISGKVVNEEKVIGVIRQYVEEKCFSKSGGDDNIPRCLLRFYSVIAWCCEHMPQYWRIPYDKLVMPLFKELMNRENKVKGRKMVYGCMKKWGGCRLVKPSLVELGFGLLANAKELRMEEEEVVSLIEAVHCSVGKVNRNSKEKIVLPHLNDMIWSVVEMILVPPFNVERIIVAIGNLIGNSIANFEAEGSFVTREFVCSKFHPLLSEKGKYFMGEKVDKKDEEFSIIVHLYTSIIISSSIVFEEVDYASIEDFIVLFMKIMFESSQASTKLLNENVWWGESGFKKDSKIVSLSENLCILIGEYVKKVKKQKESTRIFKECLLPLLNNGKYLIEEAPYVSRFVSLVSYIVEAFLVLSDANSVELLNKWIFNELVREMKEKEESSLNIFRDIYNILFQRYNGEKYKSDILNRRSFIDMFVKPNIEYLLKYRKPIEKESNKTSYLLSISYLLQSLPQSNFAEFFIKSNELQNLLPTMLEMLKNSVDGEKEIVLSGLKIVKSMLGKKEYSNVEEILKLVDIISPFLEYRSSMWVRIEAVQCFLNLMIGQKREFVKEIQRKVIKILDIPLDDRKRLVRQEARKVRTEWYFVVED